MSRVTSKLQVTIPKAIAGRYGIVPGEEIDWLPAGGAIRVVPRVGRLPVGDHNRRLDLFDRATERQHDREEAVSRTPRSVTDRGWARDEIYTRGIAG